MKLINLPYKVCKHPVASNYATIRRTTIKTKMDFHLLLRRLAFIILLFTPFYNAFTQDGDVQEDEFTTTIRIAGRYVEGIGIELRYFPEKRVVMETGFRDGFIIERSIAGEEEFVEIARLMPFDDAAWDNIMEEAEGEALDLLDLARSYLNVALTPKGGTFDFDTGISDMRRQRGDEDFEHAIFMLTAAREARAAEALAMSFTDENITVGESYTYKVRTVSEPPIYNMVPENYTIEASLDERSFDNEVFFYEGDTWINFVWEKDDRLSLYEVERMGPGAEAFILITEAPRINLGGKDFDEFHRSTFRDQELENYQGYTYRFYGHTVFGERILFAEVEAMPRDRTPPEAPRLLTIDHHAPREVLLEWEMNDPPAADLMGFVVGRAPQPDEDFQFIHAELLPQETRSFTDTTFMDDQLNYYVIQAVDTAFNVSSSIPAAVTLIDTIPPSAPVWLSGEIDSLGVVRLEVERNPERDLMGYRLFRSNDPEHEFSVIFEGFVDNDSLQDQIPTVFTDSVTLNSLTPRIYYKLRALDFNFNQSGSSEIMTIERPDTIPPTTPVFKSVVSHTDSIELYFVLSESRDVERHHLYRKTDIQAPWDIYSLLDNDQRSFTDTLANKGITYFYSMRAIDHSGNHSDFSRPVFGKAYDDGVRPGVENLSIELLDGMAVLSWDYPHLSDETYFVIYKSNNNGRLVHFRRTPDLWFRDQLHADVESIYAVKVITGDGGESLMSDTVTLESQ